MGACSLSVGKGGFLVLPAKGAGEIRMVVEAAVFRHIDDLIVCGGYLFGCQLQTVIHQISVEAHPRKFLEQLHEIAFRKAAAGRRFLDGNLLVVTILDIVQRVFQTAVGKVRAAPAAVRRGAVPGHYMEKLKQVRLDHQLIGGVALPSVGHKRQDAGSGGLTEIGACRVEAFHGAIAVYEGKNILFITGIPLRTHKDGGEENDVIVFPCL